MRVGCAVAVCVGSFRTVCTATQWLSVWTTLTDSVQTRCNCITQRSQVMPVNNTDTKPTHKTIRILPHVQAVLLLQNVQQMHWLSIRPRPAGLFACTVQPYGVPRHTQILWQFDTLRVQQNCIGKDRTLFLLLFVILNKLLFFNAYEETRLQKYVCTKGGEYDKRSVQTQNMFALSHWYLVSSLEHPFVTAVSQVQAGLRTLTLRTSMPYPHYGPVLNPEHSLYQILIPIIDQFRTPNSPYINVVSPL